MNDINAKWRYINESSTHLEAVEPTQKMTLSSNVATMTSMPACKNAE